MILIIHPYDSSTKTLLKVKNKITRKYSNDIKYFLIYPDDCSHQLCLEEIKRCTSEDLIIFLGHGTSKNLIGAKGDRFESFVSPDAIEENPDYYYNDAFINPSNYYLFEGKKLFCVACDSNKLCKKLVAKGMNSYIGFGKLPSSSNEYLYQVNNRVVAKVKGEINYLIYTTLLISINKSLDIYKCYKLMRFILSQRIGKILSTKSKYRFQIANQLFLIEDGLTYYGKDTLYQINK